MKDFVIKPINKSLESAIQEKIDNLNKPKGALGRLEELAMQVCLIQQSLTPSLTHPCHLLLGGDHGIEREGVSVSPREVTSADDQLYAWWRWREYVLSPAWF